MTHFLLCLCIKLEGWLFGCLQSYCLSMKQSVSVIFFTVMDISDIIKGKAECDEEKQYFIPFQP